MASQDTWLVVGLGNPGSDYARTRHNIGQMVIDELAGRFGTGLSAHKAGAAVGTAHVRPGGPKLLLAKPASYMNVSGRPVGALARFFSVDPAHLIVIHDELDIPFDALKLKVGGSEGGHNGLKSISQVLGTKDYQRVRVGIGRPPGRQPAADYVLKPFSAAERELLPLHLDRAADAVEALAEGTLEHAQQRFHPAPAR
ncbi:aminoacyl-tRNA hydrolase [Citricoccus sp. I39-566]|uniref:aminoacyl-tRNA hydrolase n=1 Tax=Citricoccus sp. I39-566 TaxID=3073268 RepID=UPI00286AC350|nr:aminoacyl-tRNA hydrolase [Citricoccus sp. I39-566]WMY79638.1 aminoacyl-tRNA hydrolase [Citricoccus sp. I39-566]